MSTTHLLQSLSRSVRPAFAVRGALQRRRFHGTPNNRIVHNVATVEEFEKVIATNDKVLVDCFAEWCGPCKAIAPILAKNSEDAEFKDKIHFVKFDVDALPELAAQLRVRAMPTFLFFKGGKKAEEMVGANPPMLVELMRRHV